MFRKCITNREYLGNVRISFCPQKGIKKTLWFKDYEFNNVENFWLPDILKVKSAIKTKNSFVLLMSYRSSIQVV